MMNPNQAQVLAKKLIDLITLEELLWDILMYAQI